MFCCKKHNNFSFFFLLTLQKGTSTCEAIQFSIVFIITFKQEKKMLSKEFLSTSFSKNIAALKYSIIRCYSHSPGEVIKPWDESESTRMLWYQNKENGEETMTFYNIIRLTLIWRVFPSYYLLWNVKVWLHFLSALGMSHLMFLTDVSVYVSGMCFGNFWFVRGKKWF